MVQGSCLLVHNKASPKPRSYLLHHTSTLFSNYTQFLLPLYFYFNSTNYFCWSTSLLLIIHFYTTLYGFITGKQWPNTLGVYVKWVTDTVTRQQLAVQEETLVTMCFIIYIAIFVIHTIIINIQSYEPFFWNSI